METKLPHKDTEVLSIYSLSSSLYSKKYKEKRLLSAISAIPPISEIYR